MRRVCWVICGLCVLAFAPRALAQDYVLRGSQPAYRWSGFYGGAQGGFTSSNVSFAQAPGPEVAFMLRETAIEADQHISTWSVLGQAHPENSSIGGFVGYNYEWNNVILGAELDYFHTNIRASAGGALTRSFSDSGDLPAGHNYYYTVTVAAQSSLHMADVASFRTRFGYEVGNFLPYGFVGFAMTKVGTTTGASVTYSAKDFPDSETPPLTPLPDLGPISDSQSNSQNTYAYGFAAGLGMDVGLTPNIFVRGELEYIYFAPAQGVQVSLTTARVGAGIKF